MTELNLTRRGVLIGALGAAGTALLAACGGAASPTAAPPKAAEPAKPAAAPAPTTAPAAPKPADTAKPADAAKPADKPADKPATNVQAGVSGGTPTAPTPTIPAGAKVVTFWIPWGQPERHKWVQDFGVKFREKHPDQFLKMEFVGFGNMRQRWIAAHQSGQMPEVFNVGFQEVGAAYIAGAVDRMDDVVKDMGGKEAFVDAPLAIWQYQGAYMGMPLYVFPRQYYYRKDLFEAKGIKPPTNLNEWYETSKALTTAPDKWGSALAMDHAGEPIDYVMRAQGSAMFDKDGKPLLDQPEGIEAVDLFARLIRDTAPQGTANYVEDDQVKLFIARDVGHIITWPALLQWVAQQAPQYVKNLGAIPFPAGKQKATPITSNIGYAIGKSAQNKDGAKKYLTFIQGDEPALGFMHSIAGVFPVTKSLASSPKLLDHPILKQYPDVMKIGQETAKDGVEVGFLHGFNPTNQLALSTNPGLAQMMQAIVLQNTPVKQAVDDQVKRMNAAIAQARR